MFNLSKLLLLGLSLLGKGSGVVAHDRKAGRDGWT